MLDFLVWTRGFIQKSSCSSLSSLASSLLSDYADYAQLPSFSSMESTGKRLGEQALAVLEELPEILLDLEDVLADLTTRLSFERAVERHEAIRRGAIMRSPVPTAVPRVFENVKGDIETEKHSFSSVEDLMTKSRGIQETSSKATSSSSNSKTTKKKHGTRIKLDNYPSSPIEQSLSSSFTEFDYFKSRVTFSIMRAKAVHSIKLINVGVKEDFEGRIVQTFSPSLSEFINSPVGASTISNEEDKTTTTTSSKSNTQPGEQGKKSVPSSSHSPRRVRKSAPKARIKQGLLKVLVDNATLNRFSIVYPRLFDDLNKKYHLERSTPRSKKKASSMLFYDSFLNAAGQGSDVVFAEKEEDEDEQGKVADTDDGEIDIAGVASWTPPWRDASSGKDQDHLGLERRRGGGGVHKRRNGEIDFDPIALEKLYGIDGRGGNIGGLSWRQNQGFIRPVVNARTKKEGLVIALVRLLQLTGVAVSPFRLVLWEIPRVVIINPLMYIISATTSPIARWISSNASPSYMKRTLTSYFQPVLDYIEGYIINAFLIQLKKLRIDWALWVVWNTSDQLWEFVFPFVDNEYTRPEVAASKRAILEITSIVNELNELLSDAQNILYASINVATRSWESLDRVYNRSSMMKEGIDAVDVELTLGEERNFSPSWALLAGLTRSRCLTAIVKRGNGGEGGGGEKQFDQKDHPLLNLSGFENQVDDHLQVCPFKSVFLNDQAIGTYIGWEKVHNHFEDRSNVQSGTCPFLVHPSLSSSHDNKNKVEKFISFTLGEKIKRNEGETIQREKADVLILDNGAIKHSSSLEDDLNSEVVVNVTVTSLTSLLTSVTLLPEAMVFLGPKCNNVTGLQNNNEDWVTLNRFKRLFLGLWPAQWMIPKAATAAEQRFKTRVMIKCGAVTSSNVPLMNLNQSNSARIIESIPIGKCGLDVILISPLGCTANSLKVLQKIASSIESEV